MYKTHLTIRRTAGFPEKWRQNYLVHVILKIRFIPTNSAGLIHRAKNKCVVLQFSHQFRQSTVLFILLNLMTVLLIWQSEIPTPPFKTHPLCWKAGLPPLRLHCPRPPGRLISGENQQAEFLQWYNGVTVTWPALCCHGSLGDWRWLASMVQKLQTWRSGIEVPVRSHRPPRCATHRGPPTTRKTTGC